MNELVSLLTAEDLQRVGILALLIFINWASASLVALTTRTFDIKKFPQFFVYDFLPAVLGLALMQAFMHIGLSLSNLAGAAFAKPVSATWDTILINTQLYGVFGALVLRYATSTAKNFSTLFGTVLNKAQSLAKPPPAAPPA